MSEYLSRLIERISLVSTVRKKSETLNSRYQIQHLNLKSKGKNKQMGVPVRHECSIGKQLMRRFESVMVPVGMVWFLLVLGTAKRSWSFDWLGLSFEAGRSIWEKWIDALLKNLDLRSILSAILTVDIAHTQRARKDSAFA